MNIKGWIYVWYKSRQNIILILMLFGINKDFFFQNTLKLSSSYVFVPACGLTCSLHGFAIFGESLDLEHKYECTVANTLLNKECKE